MLGNFCRGYPCSVSYAFTTALHSFLSHTTSLSPSKDIHLAFNTIFIIHTHPIHSFLIFFTPFTSDLVVFFIKPSLLYKSKSSQYSLLFLLTQLLQSQFSFTLPLSSLNPYVRFTTSSSHTSSPLHLIFFHLPSAAPIVQVSIHTAL